MAKIRFAVQVFLRAAPTVSAQVQGELIRLSGKQTVHSCSFQHPFRRKPLLLTHDHASSSFWVFFSFSSKSPTVSRSLPTLMSLLSFGRVYAPANDIILFWPALVNGQMTRCVCTGSDRHLQRKRTLVVRWDDWACCCGFFLFILNSFCFTCGVRHCRCPVVISVAVFEMYLIITIRSL